MILAEERGGDRIQTTRGSSWSPTTRALTPGTPLAGRAADLDRRGWRSAISPEPPDCLGVYGVAREVHAATGQPLENAAVGARFGGSGGRRRNRTRCSAPICPASPSARILRNVTIGPSPSWLEGPRLMAAGQRPISNVVTSPTSDAAVGQPLHSFDLDRIAGGKAHNQTRERSRARRDARRAEPATRARRRCASQDADGQTVDRGGEGWIAPLSGSTDGTTRVLMEAAKLDRAHDTSHRTGLKIGCAPRASGRFEKQKQLQPDRRSRRSPWRRS